MTVFQLDLLPKRGEATLRPDHGIDHCMQGQVGIQIRAEGAICDALADQDAEGFESSIMELSLQRQEAFDGPVARVIASNCAMKRILA